MIILVFIVFAALPWLHSNLHIFLRSCTKLFITIDMKTFDILSRLPIEEFQHYLWLGANKIFVWSRSCITFICKQVSVLQCPHFTWILNCEIIGVKYSSAKSLDFFSHLFVFQSNLNFYLLLQKYLAEQNLSFPGFFHFVLDGRHHTLPRILLPPFLNCICDWFRVCLVPMLWSMSGDQKQHLVCIVKISFCKLEGT